MANCNVFDITCRYVMAPFVVGYCWVLANIFHSLVESSFFVLGIVILCRIAILSSPPGGNQVS